MRERDEGNRDIRRKNATTGELFTNIGRQYKRCVILHTIRVGFHLHVTKTRTYPVILGLSLSISTFCCTVRWQTTNVTERRTDGRHARSISATMLCCIACHAKSCYRFQCYYSVCVQEYEMFKKHSQSLLQREKELNEKLRHLVI